MTILSNKFGGGVFSRKEAVHWFRTVSVRLPGRRSEAVEEVTPRG